MISQEKQILRTQMKAALRGFTGKEDASHRISTRLRSLDSWQEARVIYGFSPLLTEPDWRRGSVDGRQVAYPRIVGEALLFYISEEFAKNALGALEPLGGELAPPPDLVLVPGLAFDRMGHRLGRGAGFYDRWLGQREKVVAIGIAFSCQLVDAVPREEHDIQMDGILTESAYLNFLPR